MIPFNKPFAPPLGEYESLLKNIWARGWFTNNGPMVQELEIHLATYLGVDQLLLTCNGTVALQIAIRALELDGEIITTPFSYVATTSSIVWQGCTPVFADINPDTFNIDPASIEACITPQTTGILATHVFGNPCDIEAIDHIAKKYGLKVIYDAAHCFGTTFNGISVFHFGDISTTSFHATKIFQTIEGGAVFTTDTVLNNRADLMRNFGHVDFGLFSGVGINGKNSEVHAAMGLAMLPYIEEILDTRKRQYRYYTDLLSGMEVRFQRIQPGSEHNCAYFPVVFGSEREMLYYKERMEKCGVYTRRYFYPELSSLDYVKSTRETPVARDIAASVLCLPLYHCLTPQYQERVADVLQGRYHPVG